MDFKSIEKIITEQLAELEPAAINPTGAAEREPISLGGEKDNSKWLAIMREQLSKAQSFEIHCWNEETEWIELALRYGARKASGWKYGVIVSGRVTAEFAEMLLTLPKPTDTDPENKMTPFFNVFLDAHFQSCHYGTEIYILSESENEVK